ncbi:hypothetical protein CYMTET_34952 [Cymbomonas tetramitiformis]|uniref:Uncharacterized protein n=1 Tax=Cymbomonas tetramitiformis TaxID=36881 RepID=A0AAE0KPP8_9CHLO|nr:hypothetical protein CYMTET_34952 [Cymbomonas tetramitiformis]
MIQYAKRVCCRNRKVCLADGLRLSFDVVSCVGHSRLSSGGRMNCPGVFNLEDDEYRTTSLVPRAGVEAFAAKREEEEKDVEAADKHGASRMVSEHEALRVCATRISLFIFLAVPIVVIFVSLIVGGVLAAIEDWPFRDGFLYVAGQITCGTNPLVSEVPASTIGIVLSLFVGIWGLGILSVAIALVGGSILDPLVSIFALDKPAHYVPELRARKQIVKIGTIKYGGLNNFLKRLDVDDTVGISAAEFEKIAANEGILEYLDVKALSLLFKEISRHFKGTKGDHQLQVEDLEAWLTVGYRDSKTIQRKQLIVSMRTSLVYIFVTMSGVIFLTSLILGGILSIVEELLGEGCSFKDGFYFVAAMMTGSQHEMTEWFPEHFLGEFFTVIVGAIAVGVLSTLVGLVGGGILTPVIKLFSLANPRKENFWKDVNRHDIPQESLIHDYL